MREYHLVIVYRDEIGYISRIVDMDDEYHAYINFCGGYVYFESGGESYKVPPDKIEDIYMRRC